MGAAARSRPCVPARQRRRPGKVSLAFDELRIKESEIQLSMFRGRQVKMRLALLALCLSIFPPAVRAAENLGILGRHPRWKVLEKYRQTITHDEFAQLIQNVYCTHGIAPDLIAIDDDSARLLTNRDAQSFVTLRFAKDDASRERVPRLWRAAKSLPPARQEKPLSGLRIALDPGHLGGKWAKMEARWFQVEESQPVKEGDLTLKVARILAPRLKELGAKVLFVRNRNQPITATRPDDSKELGKKILIKNGVPQPREDFADPDEAAKEQTVRWESEILFYRYSEIRRRAVLVNTRLHPDLVLCLHFNAEGWGDPSHPTLIDNNHFHLLVNGSYLKDELELNDERFEMIRRLLSRAYDEELLLADIIAGPMASETHLPAYEYPNASKVRKDGSKDY